MRSRSYIYVLIHRVVQELVSASTNLLRVSTCIRRQQNRDSFKWKRYESPEAVNGGKITKVAPSYHVFQGLTT